jgi:hypothetical protein
MNTLTIRPASGVTATIEGSAASGALIKLDNADYVTIDGSNNGTNSRNLTITNTATSSPSGVWIASGATTGATSITVKNTNINLSAATSSTSYGVAISGTTIAGAGADNDNVTIENNGIISRNYGVYALATATNKFDNLIIRGNTLTTPTTNTLIPLVGVSVAQTTNAQIIENTMAGTTSGSTAPVGFAVQDGASGTQVLRNKVTQLTSTSTGGYGGRGITVGGSTVSTPATNTTIANNFIAGVGGSNFTSFGNSSTIGIAVGVAGQNTTITYWADDVNINNNTVNNVGTHLGLTSGSAKITAALFVSTNSTNVKVRNNIFIDSIDFVSTVTTTTDESVGIFAAGTAASFTAVENNLIYVPMGTQGILGNIGGTSTSTGTDYTTVAAFNTAFNATGTVNGAARFVSATDLHLIEDVNNCNVVDKGVTIASITNDIDLQARGALTDIGADELINNFVPAVAGTVGGSSITETAAVGTGNLYKETGTCNVIAYVVPAGTNPIAGNIVAKVKAESGAMLSTTRNLPFARRHFDLEPATGAETGTATITLYFTQADFNDYNNFIVSNSLTSPLLPTGPSDVAGINNLLISQFHGTGTDPSNYTGYPANPTKIEEVINPTNSNIVYNAVTGIWSVTFDVTGFSGFFLHTNQTGLAISGLNVRGAITGNTNTIYWTTQTEVNNRKFVVERSANGNMYNVLGEVATLAVNGNSNTPINYSFEDVNPLTGKAQYRLKMVDNGGRITYSPIVTLRRGAGKIEITDVRPNPTTGIVYFNVIGTASNINVVVRTLDGKQLIRKNLVQSTSFNVDLSPLAMGMYLLEAVDVRTQEKAVFKIIKH